MMTIPYQKCSSQEQAQEALQTRLPKLLKTFKAKINQKNSDQDHLTIEGSGFKILAQFQPSEIHLSLNLNFLLKNFQGKIEKKIRRELEKIL